jgi:lipopolysaccharide transport system permease protein
MGEQAGASLAWVENRRSTAWWPRLDLSDLWRYRELAGVLVIRDLKVRYKQTVIGVSWAVLQPLVAAAIFSVILGHLARLPAEGLPYPVFVFIGMSAWAYLSVGIANAALSLVGRREMVTRIYFPRLLPPLAALGPGLVDLGISLLVAGAMMAIYGVGPGIAIVTLPLWLIGLILVAIGPALWFAALNIKYRDADHALKLILQVWMWASPIVYAQSLVPGNWIYLYGVNPVVGVVEGLRWSLAGAPAPGGEAFISLAVALLLAASGLVYFRRAERHFSDLI